MKQERVAIQDLPGILRDRWLMDLTQFREYCLNKARATEEHAIRARCSRVQSRG